MIMLSQIEIQKNSSEVNITLALLTEMPMKVYLKEN